MAEGLKGPAAAWRFTHNQTGELSSCAFIIAHFLNITDLDASSGGWDLLFQYRKLDTNTKWRLMPITIPR